MAVFTSKLIVSLIDKATSPARAITRAIGGLERASQANARELAATRGRLFDAAAASFALARAISAPVNAAIQFESAMADVRKVVDFQTPAAFREMSKDIIDLSKRTPLAATGIADIVAAAGQANIPRDELLKFAEIASQVAVAFDISADSAGTALAKTKTALGLTVDGVRDLSDAINHLSNNTASAAPDLLDFMSRVGSAGKQFGFTAEQTAAIGAAMIAAGAPAEVAATSFRNVGRALARGESATKRQSAAFSRLGLDATDVAKRLQKDAVGTLNDVIARIRELPRHVQASTLSDLFGDEARAFAPLIENANLLTEALGLVSEKANFLGSSTQEYEVRAQTTANKLQLFKNQAEAVGIAIGSALLPALTNVLEILGPIVGAIADFANANPQLTTALVATVAGLVALRIASTAARFSFLFLKGGLIDLALGLSKGAAGILGLLNPLRLVTNAMRALKVALIGTGIGAILVGIGAAGAFIYNNWNGIKEAFTGFKEAFFAAIEPVRPALEPVISAFESLFDWVSGLIGPLEAMDGKWAAFGAEAGKAIGEFIVELVNFPAKAAEAVTQGASALYDAGKELIQALWDGMKELMNQLVQWVSDKIDAVFAPIRNAKSSISSFFSFGDDDAPAARGGPAGVAIDGARAAGGPITAGKTYLTGERGMELITPRENGFVHDAQTTKRLLSGGGAVAPGSRQVSVGAIHVHPAPGMDEESLARKVARAIEEMVGGGVDGIQSDTEWSVS